MFEVLRMIALAIVYGSILVGIVPALVAWARGIPTGTEGAFRRKPR